MDDRRLGAVFRALRIRRGWRQIDLARRAGVSKTAISEIECGRIDSLPAKTLRRVAAKLDVSVQISVHLPHGELDRLLNAGHAALHEAIAEYLDDLPGWVHAPEVSFAIYGERGVIDILAFHAPTGSLLIIELKTELVSLEDLLGTMDVRIRHATRIAADRGWVARSVSAWIVFADSEVTRRRVAIHRATLRSAFPADGRRMRSWLAAPDGTVRALSFWSKSAVTGANAEASIRRRVRKRDAKAQGALTPPAEELAEVLPASS